jgi:methyl-accepting chemotaxis protein
MPSSKNLNNYFVVAAVVAAELYRTLQDCRTMNLTASNAQAASLRAGQQAVGFRALTQYIDELASYTTKAARQINKLAVTTSKLAADTARSKAALMRFHQVRHKAKGAVYADSLNVVVARTEGAHRDMKANFDLRVADMRRSLEDLNQQLRSATVLAAIARIEASRVDSKNRETFTAVADTVDRAASQIKARVDYSIGLFSSM